MTRPTIAAVLPTYNRAHLLPDALESVLSQERPPDEIIVVDDGSTDETQEVLARYEGIRTIRQENGGASSSRNTGVKAARSEWIAFQDSDDAWQPGHLAVLERAVIETSGQAPVYASNLRLSPGAGGGKVFTKASLHVSAPYLFVLDGRSIVLRDHLPVMLQASLIRRKAFLEIGGLDLNTPTRHDTLLFIKLGIGAPLCLCPELGTIMGGDDAADRLTNNARGSESYERETVYMYENILESCSLAADEEAIVKHRIAAAQRNLGRIAWDAGRQGNALAHLGRSLLASPRVLLRTALKRSRRAS